MADKTGIEWTEATWNPIVGCTAVSPGCDHCYAAREASGRLSHLPLYAGLASGGVFTGEVRTVPGRLDQPMRWKRPRRIFVNSMSDLFHDGVPDEYIAQVFAIMANTPRHTYQVLTKRHGRMWALLNNVGFVRLVGITMVRLFGGGTQALWRTERSAPGLGAVPNIWPLPNVWLGVSVEDQRWADIRIPRLLDTPAAVHWLSCEPLLGPLNLQKYLQGIAYGNSARGHGIGGQTISFGPGIDWVVVGGESGPQARPMEPAWARSLRDQCVAAKVPFHFKQWGEWAPNGWRGIGDTEGISKGRERQMGEPIDAAGHRVVVERMGKKKAGRVLDGRTWDEYPAVADA